MAKKNNGTNLTKNPFKAAMKSSIDSAGYICAYILTALYNARLSDTRILALYNYFLPLNTAIQSIITALSMDTIIRKAATHAIEVTEAGLQPFIHPIFIGIETVYAKTTTNYQRLLIGGTASFYNGTRTQKVTRLNALIAAIGTDASLAAVKILAQNLVNNISGQLTTQTGSKVTVNTDSSSIKAAITNATLGVWYVYFGLMMVYITNVATAIAFLPMDYIYKAAKQTIKTLMVPRASVRKILSHLFKVGETVTIKNNTAVGLWVGLALTAKDPVAVWYFIAGNTTETEMDYRLLGNPAYKFVMVKNEDLVNSGDLTFTINGI